MNQEYKINIRDRIKVCDHKWFTVSISMEEIHNYLKNKGWILIGDFSGYLGFDWKKDDVEISTGNNPLFFSEDIEFIASLENRLPSEVLSDIVGYPVGIDKNRLRVLRNSAGAYIVEAKEALERAEVTLKAKPKNANLISAVEISNKNLKKTEEEFNKLTKALEMVE